MDKNDQTIDFLTSYFYYDMIYERCVYHGDEKNREEPFSPLFGRMEGSSCFCWESSDDLKPYIEANFDLAYSAFQTDFINGYINITKPAYLAILQEIIRMSIDTIAKQSLGIISQQYYGSAIIGAGEKDWAKFYDFPFREEIR